MRTYDTYKDSGISWLGQIPSHWEVRRTKNLWHEVKDLSADGQEQLLSVSQYDGITENQDGSRSESLKGYKIVKQNNLVINIMLAWMGGLGVSQYDGIVSPAYCVYNLHDKFNAQYYHYLYRTPAYLAEFARRSTGVIPSRWRMYTDEFGCVASIIPPLAEQDAIVAYLKEATKSIDAAITQQQKMIDLLKERKQIIINEAVTRGLNPDVPMQETGIEWLPQIPAHWRIRRFKNLFRTRTGISFTIAQIEDEGEQVISYGQIHSKDNWFASINPALIRHIPASLVVGYDGAIAKYGDFLFADTSEDFEGCGNCIFVDTYDKLYAGYHTILAKKDNDEYGQYLAYLFASTNWRGQLRSAVNGVKVYSVTQTILNGVYVILPPIDEQKDIANFVTDRIKPIDTSIERCKRMIELLTERKQIVINDVVTGKIKVS